MNLSYQPQRWISGEHMLLLMLWNTGLVWPDISIFRSKLKLWTSAWSSLIFQALGINSTYFLKCAGQAKHICDTDVAQDLPVYNLCFKGETVPCLHGTNYCLSTNCSNRIKLLWWLTWTLVSKPLSFTLPHGERLNDEGACWVEEGAPGVLEVGPPGLEPC